MDEVDIAIVGAGAAGLAAARALEEEPVSVVVLEARARTGGRGHTITQHGYGLDLGCGWLHSADVNLFAELAETLGFPLDKTPPPWMQQVSHAGFSPAEQVRFGEALATLEARVEEVAGHGADRPVADLMAPNCPANPLLDAFSAYYNGVEFDQVSTLDYAAYDDSEINWRTPLGYGALIAAFGAPAPVIMATPVRRIDHSGPRIRLETPNGTLSARAAIVTASTPIIADGALAFTPDLPALREAAASLPLGLANKVYLAVDEPEAFPLESHLFGAPSRTETGSYHLRPFGRPLIEVFVGGRHAWLLESEGEGAAAAFAIEELSTLLGASLRDRLHPIAATTWGADPWSRGAYSHAAPGAAWARAVLGQSIDDRLFFAGEATSPHAFSTAHGAAQTGRLAARSAIRALN